MDQVIRRFNERGIRYLVIGGQAVRLHGLLRETMDWDFAVPPRDAKNIAAINDALSDLLDDTLEILGQRGEGFVQTFQTPWGVLQFHLLIPGLPDFDEAEKRAVEVDDNGTPVRCLCADDLLHAKRASARVRDELDIKFLEQKLKT